MIPIYDNIREVAKEKKVSIRSLEDCAGLGTGSVCKWNVVSPSVNSLMKVATLLEVPLDALLKTR